MQSFNSARLRFRPILSSDLPWLEQLFADPEVMRFIGEYHPRNSEETLASLDRMLQHWSTYQFGIFAVELLENQEPIGRCGLGYLHQSDTPELSYSFFQRYWGQGYATEAARAVIRYGFESLRFRRIIGHALKANQASLKVMEKASMHCVGETIIDGLEAIGYEIENPNPNGTSF